MGQSFARRFPVTVTQLPVTRWQICQRTVVYRPGRRPDRGPDWVLHRRAHPEALDLASREPIAETPH